MSDLGGDFDKKTGTPLSGSGESISGDIQFSDMDAPMPDASGGNQSPSEMPDLTADFSKTTGTPLSGSGESISGDTKFYDMDVLMLNDSGDLCEKKRKW